MKLTSTTPEFARLERINPSDLVRGGVEDVVLALSKAVRLGYDDRLAGRKRKRTGNKIANAVCYRWRNGYERALMAAYSAGWFKAEMQGKGEPER